VRNAQLCSESDLESIVTAGRGHVTFELAE
jgi:hypothetical protein